MKLQIIGIQRKTGTFTNQETGKTYDYDNFNLHCTGKSMKVSGSCVREVKLKASEAAELIAECGGKPESVVGHTVDFEFAPYGGVDAYELVK